MKKISLLSVLLLIFSVAAVSAQELEPAASSNLTGVSLPSGAHRIAPSSVPAEINETLDKFIAAGEGKIRKGATEVLVWGGAGYSKAGANTMTDGLVGSLKNAGWQYAVEGAESGITIFSLLKDGTSRRAIIGFFGANDDALVVTFMEVLSNEVAGGGQNNGGGGNSTGGGSIVGTWTNGNVSMISEKNLATGAISSRGGSTFKYVFNANGTFEFIGLMNSTVYGCTTSLFNDKRGRYEISGSNITLIPSKNFWRNMYSCSPASNKEKNHVLDPETYSFRTKTDEYGATLICLAKTGSEEACYRKE